MKEKNPTSFDIAYMAGVSQSTVSRALRDSPLVNKETREKVQRIARELNYKVDKNASNLRMQKTKTLALLLCEDKGPGNLLINPFFLSMLGSITRAASERGYDLLVSFQQYSEDWHADYEFAHRADGIIFLGYGDWIVYQQKIQYLTEVGTHFITWGPVLEGQSGVAIGCNNEQGAYEVVSHLIRMGRRNIAFLGDIADRSPEFKARYAGYCRALQDAGITPQAQLQISAETSEDEGFNAMERLLASSDREGFSIDGVFGASDVIAIGAIKALEQAGKVIPDDVAVVGFDDIPISSFTHPPLTTVQQDTFIAGELLVNNLLKMIEGESVQSLSLDARLVVRRSCGSRV